MIDLFDLDAEAAVLSAVLLETTPQGAEPGAFAVARTIVSPEHFYSEAHRRIFEGFVDLADRGEAIDVVLVASWLRDHDRLAQVGGMAYLAQVIGAAPAVTHVKNYARVVRRLAEQRELVAALERAVLEIRSGHDSADVLTKMTATVDEIVARGAS